MNFFLPAWRTVVRMGAINCYGEENRDLCRQHGVHGYPTIRVSEEVLFS